ncbi:MAG TPA: CHAT domain-containing protein [Terracidiphilus sp.]
MKWLNRLVMLLAGVTSLILPPPQWLLKYGWIMIWSGVATLAAREIFAIGADFVFEESHKKMTTRELTFHSLLVLSFVVIGFLLSGLLPRFGIGALAMQALLMQELDTRSFLTFMLRRRLARDLRCGRLSSAQTVGARLFDVMLVRGLSDKSRHSYLDFGKSAMVLAELREGLGDFRSAAFLYGWARERFLKAGLSRNNSLQRSLVVPMISASCGMVRASVLINPAKAAEDLRLTQKLADPYPIPEVAARILMVGGKVSPTAENLAMSSSGANAVETIMQKYALPVFETVIWQPKYEQVLAATVLARRFSSRGRNEEATRIAERLSSYLRGHSDIRFILLWIEMEELRSDLLPLQTHFEQCRSILEGVIEAIKGHLFERAQSGNETELLSLSDVASGALARLVGILVVGIKEKYTTSCNVLDTSVQLKGIAAWVRTNLTRALSTDLEDPFQKQAVKLKELRNRMSAFWTDPEGASINFDLDRFEGERLESLLIHGRLPEDWIADIRNVSIHSVRQCLKSDEVLLDFTAARYQDGTMMYVACPCIAEDENPLPIEIGPKDLIDSAIWKWRMLVQLGANPRPNEDTTSFLQARLVDPLLGFLQKATRIIVVCDTHLSFFPFEAFRDGNGELLVKSYEWVYSASFREILLRKHRNQSPERRSVVFAAPEYNWPSATSSGNDDQAVFKRLAFAHDEGSNIAKCIDAGESCAISLRISGILFPTLRNLGLGQRKRPGCRLGRGHTFAQHSSLSPSRIPIGFVRSLLAQ